MTTGPRAGGGAGPLAGRVAAAGGEAVAEYSDAADPGSGQAMVAAALRRWGRLDICVADAAIGVGGMFHRQAAEQFDEVLAINLQGSIRQSWLASAVSQDCRLNGEYIVTGGGAAARVGGGVGHRAAA